MYYICDFDLWGTNVENFDSIVIGSGFGGLACGAALASKGRRVLLCERHSKIGGYGHSFKRKGFVFESGIHSVPIGPDGFIKNFLRLCGDTEPLPTTEIPCLHGMQTPATRFSVPSCRESALQSFCAGFPFERDALHNLFACMDSFYENLIVPILHSDHTFADEHLGFLKPYLHLSFQDLVNHYITDPRLRTILVSQWPYGGIAPHLAPTAFYSLMFIVHLIEGSHTIPGGLSVLADRLAAIICRNGGEVRTRCTVASLDVSNDRADAVVLDNGERIQAGMVISNVSPYTLHNQIVPEHARNKLWLRRLSNLNPSISSVIVYLGLNRDIGAQLSDTLFFWYDTDDFEKLWAEIESGKRDPLNHLVLLRSADPLHPPTLTLMYFVRQSHSTDWKRDKMVYAKLMLDKAAELVDGLASAIECTEVGSPDTFERYTGNTAGALYGFENTKALYGEAKLPHTTHLKNLFQTGHWGKPGGGVWNVIANGYSTAKTIEASGI